MNQIQMNIQKVNLLKKVKNHLIKRNLILKYKLMNLKIIFKM